MPIIKSAKKRARQTVKRAERNRPFKTRMLTLIKNILKWGDAGETEKVAAHIDETYSAIDTAAKRNLIHKNNAARKKSLVKKTLAKLEKENGPATPKKAAPKKAAPAKTAAKPAAKKATPAKKPAAKKTTAKKTEK